MRWLIGKACLGVALFLSVAGAAAPSKFETVFQNLRVASDRLQARRALEVLSHEGELPEAMRFLYALSPVHFLVLERHQLLALFSLNLENSYRYWMAFRLPELTFDPVPTSPKWIGVVNARLHVELETLFRRMRVDEIPEHSTEQAEWFQQQNASMNALIGQLLILSENEIPLSFENAKLLESILKRVFDNIKRATATQPHPILTTFFSLFVNHGLIMCDFILKLAQNAQYDSTTTADVFQERWERILTDYLISTPGRIQRIQRGLNQELRNIDGPGTARMRSSLKEAVRVLPSLLAVTYTLGQNVEAWLTRVPKPTENSSIHSIQQFFRKARRAPSSDFFNPFGYSPISYGDEMNEAWRRYEASVGETLPELRDVELEFHTPWTIFSSYANDSSTIVISIPKRARFFTKKKYDEATGEELAEPVPFTEAEYYTQFVLGQLWLGPGYWLAHTDDQGKTLIYYLTADERVPESLMRPGRTRIYTHIHSWTTPLEGDTWFDENYDAEAWQLLQTAAKEQFRMDEPITARQLAAVLIDKAGLSQDFPLYMYQGAHDGNVYYNCVSSLTRYSSRDGASEVKHDSLAGLSISESE